MRSLLSLVVVGIVVPLAAQSVPHLDAAVVPGRLDTRITRCAPGALAALVLGFAPAALPLPGGAVLGVDPVCVVGLTFADALGMAVIGLQFPPGQGAGLQFLAAGLTYDVQQPLEAPGALQATPAHSLRMPAVGDVADLVVLFGQSNAEGSAALAELPVALRGPLPNLRVWNDVAAAWQPLEGGYNNQLFPLVPRVGPEMGMAEAAALLPSPTWLVKFAVAQSSLGPTPGPWSEWGAAAGELLPELLRRISVASAALRSVGLVPNVRLVAMMQGETDALDPALAQAYAGHLADLVVALRAELATRGLVGADPVQFRFGLVAPHLEQLGFVATAAVRAAQQAVAASLPDCATVETAALALQPDQVHFALGGLLALGRAFLVGLH